METIVKLNKWANSHTSILTDALRVGLGVFLIYKGLMFIDQTEYLMSLITVTNHDMVSTFMAHYIAPVNLVGGLFITIGFFTRLSIVFQLPILIGVVIVGFSVGNHQIELLHALLTFAACMFFLVYGSGKHSIDYKMQLNA